MADEKQIGRWALVDDWRDWKNWWSIRWTAIAAAFSAMSAAAASAHSPWWVSVLCAGAAALCNGASGTSRVIAQKPKDGNSPTNT